MDREYAILGGINRSKVGRYIYVAASTVSAGIVFLLLAFVDIAQRWGTNVNVPPGLLALVGAATVYLGLYALFDRYIWKIKRVQGLLKLPDLSGRWQCAGLTLEKEPNLEWFGTIVIVQSWDKIRLRLETAQSRSDSQAAALQHDSAAGFRLFYHYTNAPKIGEQNLSGHHGFAEIIFSADLKTASGEYFNGRGRNTFGKMTLIREAN